MDAASTVFRPAPAGRALETAAAWLLGVVWILPLAYAVWTAFHPAAYSTRFEIGAPLTLQNFVNAWNAAPFARYFLNTTLLVTMVLAAQLVLGTLAAYALARFEFPGRDLVFGLILVQLMVMPDVLIVENYRTMNALVVVTTASGSSLSPGVCVSCPSLNRSTVGFSSTISPNSPASRCSMPAT